MASHSETKSCGGRFADQVLFVLETCQDPTGLTFEEHPIFIALYCENPSAFDKLLGDFSSCPPGRTRHCRHCRPMTYVHSYYLPRTAADTVLVQAESPLVELCFLLLLRFGFSRAWLDTAHALVSFTLGRIVLASDACRISFSIRRHSSWFHPQSLLQGRPA